MIREIEKEGKKLYQCDECKLNYEEEKWAKMCQEWCKKYKSCNLEITKKAVIQKIENG